METSLKKEAEEFFQSVGLDVTTVIRFFLNRVLIRKKISFEKESKESISRAQALEIFFRIVCQRKKCRKYPWTKSMLKFRASRKKQSDCIQMIVAPRDVHKKNLILPQTDK